MWRGEMRRSDDFWSLPRLRAVPYDTCDIGCVELREKTTPGRMHEHQWMEQVIFVFRGCRCPFEYRAPCVSKIVLVPRASNLMPWALSPLPKSHAIGLPVCYFYFVILSFQDWHWPKRHNLIYAPDLPADSLPKTRKVESFGFWPNAQDQSPKTTRITLTRLTKDQRLLSTSQPMQ